MRKDRVLAGALAAVTALSMTACGGGQAGGTTQAAAAGTQAAAENTANPNAETTLSIGYTTAANADDPYHFTATKFKEIVEEKSEGRIAVNLYASSQLGSEPEMWEGMQTGTCDMAVMTNAYVSSYVPANGALDLPFIFSDLAQAREIVDGDFGQSLIDNMVYKGQRNQSTVRFEWTEDPLHGDKDLSVCLQGAGCKCNPDGMGRAFNRSAAGYRRWL